MWYFLLQDNSLLAVPKSLEDYEDLRTLGTGITEAQDVQTRRAFIGMFCG